MIEEFRSAGGTTRFSRDAAAEMLLLHHRGAKTGEERVSPLVYFDIDGKIVVIASYGGGPRNPGWHYNLVAHPTVAVEIGTETRSMHARLTDGEERSRLFEAVKVAQPGFGAYERTASPREIPVWVLEPSV